MKIQINKPMNWRPRRSGMIVWRSSERREVLWMGERGGEKESSREYCRRRRREAPAERKKSCTVRLKIRPSVRKDIWGWRGRDKFRPCICLFIYISMFYLSVYVSICLRVSVCVKVHNTNYVTINFEKEMLIGKGIVLTEKRSNILLLQRNPIDFYGKK